MHACVHARSCPVVPAAMHLNLSARGAVPSQRQQRGSEASRPAIENPLFKILVRTVTAILHLCR
jgi:hypothetical protein